MDDEEIRRALTLQLAYVREWRAQVRRMETEAASAESILTRKLAKLAGKDGAFDDGSPWTDA